MNTQTQNTHFALSAHRSLHFPTQRPNEHIILLLRRHWIIFGRNIVHWLFLVFFPIILIIAVVWFTDFSFFSLSRVTSILIIEGFSLYYLFCLLGYFYRFVDYHLDIWVVTDQRVVSIEQQGLFNRVISELNILKIQDVTSEVKGKVQTFLDYGQVYIQTAGKEERFVFEEVPRPSQVAKIILQAHDHAAKVDEYQKVKESEEYRHQIDTQYQKMPKNTATTNTHIPTPEEQAEADTHIKTQQLK